MAFQIVLPKLGLTMQEGVIGGWVATPGQRVSLGDTLFRVETDKVDVDVEAESEGVLATAAEAGAVLPVGAVVGWLLADGESVPEGGASPDGDAGQGSAASSAAPTPTPAAVPLNGIGSTDGRLKASPNARRVASEAGVDLHTLTGTGPGGWAGVSAVMRLPPSTAPSTSPPRSPRSRRSPRPARRTGPR